MGKCQSTQSCSGAQIRLEECIRPLPKVTISKIKENPILELASGYFITKPEIKTSQIEEDQQNEICFYQIPADNIFQLSYEKINELEKQNKTIKSFEIVDLNMRYSEDL